jgi:hypothetical protein
MFEKTDSVIEKATRQAFALRVLDKWITRGTKERFVVETVVTPEMAQMLLDRNWENRLIRKSVVNSYAQAMLRGEWSLNGEYIIISSNGVLNDGQHRLMAVIENGLPVVMGLQFGVERNSRTTLNTGFKRTLADHLTMQGQGNAHLLSATVRLAWNYDSGIYSLSQAPSVDQAFNYIEENPGVKEFLSIGASVGTQFSTSGSQFSFAAFVCARENHNTSRELIDRIKDGLGLESANLPAARVRERLMQHLTNKLPLRRNEPSAIYIKAFNAAKDGRRLRHLSWSASGPTAEPYPIAGK